MNYRPVVSECGLLLTREHVSEVHDDHGCVLPVGHVGPHEIATEDGQAWQWETDSECACESCLNDGDFCVMYWPKDTSQQPA